MGIMARGLPCSPTSHYRGLHHSNTAQAALVGWALMDIPIYGSRWEAAYGDTGCTTYPNMTAAYNVLYGVLSLGGLVGNATVDGLVAISSGYAGVQLLGRVYNDIILPL